MGKPLLAGITVSNIIGVYHGWGKVPALIFGLRSII